MRQGQQNRRGRGRNNRKSQNPMTRSFESTGPDVKLRGTPSHIAEKYMSLARDALSSGDPVLAENYMQHAEHYNRILMTFREQQMSQGGGDPFASGMGRPASIGGPDADGEEEGDDDGDDFGGDNRPMMGQPDMQPQQPMHQPRSFDQPQRFDNRPQHQRRDNRHNNNNNRNDRGENRFDRGDRPDRGDRQDRPDRNNRQDFRPDRNQERNQDRQQDRGPDRNPDRNQDRNGGGEQRSFREDRPALQPVTEPAADNRPVRRERFQAPPPAEQPAPAPAHLDQPEFLRRPVRRPRRDDAEASPAPRPPVTDEQD